MSKQSVLQKMKQFMKAFSEFLRRPKTVFDIKDRAKLLLLFFAVIGIIEGIICYLQK